MLEEIQDLRECPSPRLEERLRDPAREAALSDHDLLLISEIAYGRKEFALGVEAMEHLLRRKPHDAAMHFRLGHFRMLAGDPGAAACFQRAIAHDPQFQPAYQALVQVADLESDADAAIFYLKAQAKACGTTPTLASQMAAWLTRAGRMGEAISLLERLNAASDVLEHTLRLEAELRMANGEFDRAADCASRLWRLTRTPEAALLLCHLLSHQRKFAEIVDAFADQFSELEGRPDLALILSRALAETGDERRALRFAMLAARLSPQNMECLYHVARLAEQFGYVDQARSLLAKALALAPENRELLLSSGNLALRAGDRTGAVDFYQRARDLEPDNEAIRNLILHVQSGAEVSVAGVGDGGASLRPLPRRSSRRGSRDDEATSLWTALVVQVRVIYALVGRGLEHRAVGSKFGFVSLLLEPMFQVVITGVIVSLFNGNRPPLGTHFYFFYATGLLPLYLFIHICNHTLNIFADKATLLQVPLIKRLDLVIAESLTELLVCGSTTIITFVALDLLGQAPHSENHFAAVEAYLMVYVFAVGMGLIGAVFNNYNPAYAKIYRVSERVLYFISGVIILAENMPVFIREYLVWNPMVILITWFRTGFFPSYSPPWLDKGYVVTVCFACLLLGLMLERAMRKKMKTLVIGA